MGLPVQFVDELVSAPARKQADRQALFFEGARWTYGELDAWVERFAGGVRRLGIRPGEVIALFLESVPELVVAYLGGVRAGAVVNIVNGMLKGDETAFILADSEARLLVTDEQRLRLLEGRWSQLPALSWVAVCEAEGPAAPAGAGRPEVIPFEHLASPRETAAGGGAQAARDPGALCTLMYTSGTTGRPKGVMLSHTNIVDNAVQFARIHYRAGDLVAAGAPLFHCWALINGVLGAFAAGAAAAPMRRFQTEPALDLIETVRPTIFLGVPTMYNYLLKSPSLPRRDLSSLRFVLSAAAPAPVELIRRLREIGIGYAEAYGLTETSPVITTAPAAETRPGSCGRAMGDTELKVVAAGDSPDGALTGEAGEGLPPGQVGELWARGTAIMLGYFKRPEATAEVMRPGGWFRTGDIVRMDEEGYVYIVDRAKDMINVGGEKVYPREVEEVLHAHPAVVDAAVIGEPDPDRGEVPKAFVVLREGSPVTGRELAAFCHERLAGFKVPRSFDLVDSIPRSPSGKVLRRLLRLGKTEADFGGPSPAPSDGRTPTACGDGKEGSESVETVSRRQVLKAAGVAGSSLALAAAFGGPLAAVARASYHRAATTGATAAVGRPLKVGLIASLTGVVQAWGRAARQGAELAVDEINAAGGVLGRPLQLVVEDDESNAEVGLRKARKLVLQDEADVLVGINHSGVLLGVVAALPELKRVLIGSCATSARATTQAFNRYVFRVHSNSEMEGASGAYYASQLPYKRWSVIAPDYSYGYETWGAFAGKLKELRPDVEILQVQAWPPFGAGDYASHLTRLMAARPDAVLSAMWGGDAVTLIRQAKLFRFFDRVAFFSPAALALDVFYALGPEIPEGLHTPAHGYWFEYPPIERNRRFVSRFAERFSEYPHPTAHDTYAAVRLYKVGVERAGTPETEALIEALEGVTLETPAYDKWIRPADHQAIFDIPWGRTVRRPDLPFGVGVGELQVVPAAQLATPEEEVLRLRRLQAEPEYLKYIVKG